MDLRTFGRRSLLPLVCIMVLATLLAPASCSRNAEERSDTGKSVAPSPKSGAEGSLDSSLDKTQSTSGASFVSPDEVTRLLERHAMISTDPLATLRQLGVQAYVHGPVAIDPASGLWFLAQPAATVVLPEGELALTLTWRGGSEAKASFDLDLGPDSTRCNQGALCDESGRVLSFYEGEAKLTVRWEEGVPQEIKLGSLVLVTFQWKDGRLARLETLSGASRSFEWDSAGDLTSTFDGSQTTRYRYDTAHRLVGLDGGEGDLRFDLDTRGRITKVEGPPGTVSRLVWEDDDAAHGCTVTDPVGGKTSYEWSPAKRTFTTRDALGAVTVLKRNAVGQIVAAATPDGASMRMEYDNSGHLKSLAGPAGQQQTLKWENGALVGVVENSREAVVQYNADGRLMELSLSPDFKVAFSRDSKGRIAQVDLPGGRVLRFSHDAFDRILRTEDESGVLEVREYNERGLLAATTDGTGKKTTYAYDPKGRLSSRAFPDGTTESWSWNLHDRLVATVDRSGTRTEFRIDGKGRISGVKRGSNEALNFKFDRLGRIIQEERAAGLRRFTYDPLGRLTTISREDGILESLEWDQMGRLVARKLDGKSVWEGRYDALGLLVEEKDVTGESKFYTYDKFQRLSSISKEGQKLSVTWSSDGGAVWRDDVAGVTWKLKQTGTDGALRVVGIQSDTGSVRRWTYTSWGAPLQRSDVGGETVSWSYDEHRMPSLLESTRSGKTQLAFDPSGRITHFEGTGELVRAFRYDDRGNLATVGVPDGDWKYGYDGSNRLISARNPAGYETLLFWDARGHLSGRTTPNGETEHLVSDKQGRLKRRTLADGSVETFEWDDAGRLLSWLRDGKVLRRLEYGDTGQMTRDEGLTHKTRLSRTSDGASTTVSHEDLNLSLTTLRDAAGRILSLNIPGVGSATYQRDSVGRLERVRLGSGNALTIHRDALGRKDLVSLAEGGTIGYVYNEVGLLQEIKVDSPSKPPLLFQFEHNDGGRLVGCKLGNHALQYGYDASGRLSWFDSSDEGKTFYVYDQAGSLIEAGSETIQRGKDEASIATKAGPRTYLASGAVETAATSQGQRSFQYDLARRLQSVTLEDGLKVSYTYDGNGNLRSRRLVTADGSQPAKSTFLHLNNDVVAQLKGTVAEAFYVPGEGPGERLAVLSGGTASFYVQGPDGTTLAMLDGTGKVLALFVHEPFGRIIATEGSMEEPFHFRGHFMDPATGYLHYPMRWADPSSFSFLAPDPDAGFLARPETQNRYSFLANDPVNLIDPLGANPFEWDHTSTTLEGVCNLFQKGEVNSGYGMGNALDGFKYGGSIDRGGWSYDIWNKRVPGTNKVVTYIRDLSTKADGPYGKANFTGNFMVRDTPAVVEAVEESASQQGPGFFQRIGDSVRNTAQSAKHGVQLYGKEISGTVAGLGGVSGTLGTSVGTIIALPGGVFIVGAGVGAAGAVGYGAGTLINKIPAVSNGAQSAMSSMFGYQQNQDRANFKAELENQGDRSKELQAKIVAENIKNFEASGLPLNDENPGLSQGTVDLGGPTPELAVPTPELALVVPESTIEDKTNTEPTPGTENRHRKPKTEKPEGPDSKENASVDDDEDEEEDRSTREEDDEDEEEDRSTREEDDEDEEEDRATREEDDEDEAVSKWGEYEPHESGLEEPDNPGENTLLDYVIPERVSVSFQTEEDASFQEFENTVTCKYVVTFWNVGSQVPGYGGAVIKGVCTASINGVTADMDGSGTFSGGPNGTVSLGGKMGLNIRISGGQTAIIPEVGSTSLRNPGAFSDWPK